MLYGEITQFIFAGVNNYRVFTSKEPFTKILFFKACYLEEKNTLPEFEFMEHYSADWCRILSNAHNIIFSIFFS